MAFHRTVWCNYLWHTLCAVVVIEIYICCLIHAPFIISSFIRVLMNTPLMATHFCWDKFCPTVEAACRMKSKKTQRKNATVDCDLRIRIYTVRSKWDISPSEGHFGVKTKIKPCSKLKWSKLATSMGPSEWRIWKGTTYGHLRHPWSFVQGSFFCNLYNNEQTKAKTGREYNNKKKRKISKE